MKRNGYRMDSGGPDSKIFKSKDSGETWEELSGNEGLPNGPWGIVGLAVSPVNSRRVFAIIEGGRWGCFQV